MEGYDKARCFYCGFEGPPWLMANDHWPPKSRKYEFADRPHLLVRACKNCNSRLSSSMQATLEDRKRVACGADKALFEIKPEPGEEREATW